VHLRRPGDVDPSSAHSSVVDIMVVIVLIVVVVVANVHDAWLRLGGRDDARLTGNRSTDRSTETGGDKAAEDRPE